MFQMIDVGVLQDWRYFMMKMDFYWCYRHLKKLSFRNLERSAPEMKVVSTQGTVPQVWIFQSIFMSLALSSIHVCGCWGFWIIPREVFLKGGNGGRDPEASGILLGKHPRRWGNNSDAVGRVSNVKFLSFTLPMNTQVYT